ncbi:beta-1,4-galactosyltransferase galt-1-like [Scylla paramamosain]|uniref:beta-1,4-galactosyltransferase galt-1-like n=1 Tax=Scylla paramamosain TaxID=85552 RepID=UPI0030829A0B
MAGECAGRLAIGWLLLMRKRAWVGVVGVVCTCVLVLLTAFHDSRVSHVCDCGHQVNTEERVAKYLPNLMGEIDPTTKRTTLQEVEAVHPSLALAFLVEQERRGSRCHNTPGVFSVRHNNELWQEAVIGGVIFLLYAAYYDSRDEGEGPTVRMLVMVDSTRPPTPVCHLWYQDDLTPTASSAVRMDYVHWQDRVSGAWLPYLVTCRVVEDLRGVPRVAALVGYSCGPATNALRVLNQEQPRVKKDLALCHKFLFDPTRDYSQRLVEWLEVARAWGVDEVTFYEASVHPNVRAVLQYYQQEGFVQVFPWRSPGDQPSLGHLYRALYDTQRFTLFTTENIPYTDCLLRHLATHRYVAVWDMDEFIVPATAFSLPAMLDAARARATEQGLRPTSYLARCSYYFDDQVEEATPDLPEYLYLMRHVTRTVKVAPPRVFTKSVHDTSLALGLHAHFALLTLGGNIDRDRDLYHLYPTTEGHLGHYRATCQGEDQHECQELYRPYLSRDTAMWRHRPAVTARTKAVLQILGLLP